ncbi:MAG: SDR family NAD(P)-dependent oxidoreductase, partial [Clostridia bacterium]|nr:SDR family NAD(P)-dependent oxidoreductase [Clostridia bacterium]
MTILVTGGTGYIGSHTCVELLSQGYDVVIADNFSNSKPEVLKRIKRITGKGPVFHKVDLLDDHALDSVFKAHTIDAVIHFAGLKAVGESVAKPLEYYHNNLTGTLNLLKAMRENNVKKLVFSSSATVYGSPDRVPITEDASLSATNPYGHTKLMLEQV